MRRMMRGLVRFARDFALGIHTAHGIRHGVVRPESKREPAAETAEEGRVRVIRGGSPVTRRTPGWPHPAPSGS